MNKDSKSPRATPPPLSDIKVLNFKHKWNLHTSISEGITSPFLFQLKNLTKKP